MIEPFDTLAFALRAPKGSCAVLLGSGVSRAAQMPTGWDVVLDLIEQLALAKGASHGGDPVGWYGKEFGEEPNYSKLLRDLSLDSRAARQQLLKGYFQPAPEEAERGVKTPTKAHAAIARLVKSGHVRVIVTTNFDRLAERALDAEGVEYTTVSTPSQVAGMLPLRYLDCLVFKVNGDYLETTIKNTEEELSTYDDATNKLLDQIFDECGLIVCGWSAEHDVALRQALERCPTRRFSTYWTKRGTLTDAAQSLVDQRRAQVVQIESADSFFTQLEAKVAAIEEFNKPHPLSPSLAVAGVRRNIQDGRLIDLETSVMGEVSRVCDALTAENFPINPASLTRDFYRARLKQYEALTEVLRAMMAAGCYFGGDGDGRLWARAVDLVGRRATIPNGQYFAALLNLCLYPALLLFYAGGIGAVAAGKLTTLAGLVTGPKFSRRDGTTNEDDLIISLSYLRVIGDAKEFLPEGAPAPISDHLHDTLRDSLRHVLPQEHEYTRAFDLFEYLVGLLTVHEYEKMYGNGVFRLGFGDYRFLRRYTHPIYDVNSHPISRQVETEIGKAGEAWPPLRAGLFDGSLERLRTVKAGFDKSMSWR